MIILEILAFIGGCILMLIVVSFIAKIGENKVTEKHVELKGGNRNDKN